MFLEEGRSRVNWCGPKKPDHRLRWFFAGLVQKRKRTMKAKRKWHSAVFNAKLGFDSGPHSRVVWVPAAGNGRPGLD